MKRKERNESASYDLGMCRYECSFDYETMDATQRVRASK
jgi:hypothetical protein